MDDLIPESSVWTGDGLAFGKLNLYKLPHSLSEAMRDAENQSL